MFKNSFFEKMIGNTSYRGFVLIFVSIFTFCSISSGCSDDGGEVFEPDSAVDAAPRIDADLSQFDFPARVLSIIDGDTIRVSFHGETETIRFIGVDAPELTPQPEPYGPEAEQYTRDKLPVLSYIGLEFDDDACGGAQRPAHCYDVYDRLLAYIRTEKGDDLGILLLSTGLARLYTYGDFGRKPEYEETEQYAKNLGVGIWSL
jgi:micrococcal nuclease